jgi:membrane protease YdiL (CAAX protease family)
MHERFKILSIILLALTGVVLIGLQMKPLGFLLLGFGFLSLIFCEKKFRRDIALLYLSLAILGLTPISTLITPLHVVQMGIPLTLVVIIPYIISRYMYKNYLVRFQWHHGRKWTKKEILYIFIAAFLAYLILPLMLQSADSYKNWGIQPTLESLITSYIGLNTVAFWDEFFFIVTVFGILRHHLSFLWANTTQSVLFTAFLYTLGFQGWSFIVIFIFAFVQGYIFKKTESLLYVLTIHLIFDLILHLTLVYLHYPSLLPIFILS